MHNLSKWTAENYIFLRTKKIASQPLIQVTVLNADWYNCRINCKQTFDLGSKNIWVQTSCIKILRTKLYQSIVIQQEDKSQYTIIASNLFISNYFIWLLAHQELSISILFIFPIHFKQWGTGANFRWVVKVVVVNNFS